MKRDSHLGRTVIFMSWSERVTSKGLVAYRSDSMELVYSIMDYALYLLDVEQLKLVTVKNQVLHVKRFLEDIWADSKDLVDITDQSIEDFRDRELESVHKSPNGFRSSLAHKRTVNEKLRRIYHFLSWLQEIDKSQVGLMGAEKARVTSTLSIRTRQADRSRRKGGRKSDHPKTYPRVGEGSKHRVAYCATEQDIENLQAYFFATSSSMIARRNILMMDICETTGMRRGSVNSLRCAQFKREYVETAGDAIEVIPDAQKNSYEKAYSVPISLAMRIVEYIESDREKMVEERGRDVKHTGDRIFVSGRSGTPLRDQTLSEIFGAGYRYLIPGLRAACHSFRHKYGNDKIETETDARVELGLDTSVQSIAASVSMSMGQENPASLEPYVSREMGRRRGKKSTDADRLAELERENRDLKQQLERMKSKRSD